MFLLIMLLLLPSGNITNTLLSKIMHQQPSNIIKLIIEHKKVQYFGIHVEANLCSLAAQKSKEINLRNAVYL